MKEVQIYSPATIANLCCGFDILGMSLNKPLDKMILRKLDYTGVHICNIYGANLSKEPDKNIVGVVLKKILNDLPNNKYGIEVEIYKNIKPGSGIGSSAASAAGAAVGANLLFGNPFKTIDIIKYAIEGEKFASGTPHADNVAPAIMGGITLVKSNNPLEIISLPSPKNLWVTVIHPQLEIKTSNARKILEEKISLKDTTKQCGNLGAFTAAIYREDYQLLGKSLQDFIAEPFRKKLIPSFDEIKLKCKNIGALGGGISGSGPSVFMFSESYDMANKIAKEMNYIYNKLNINYKIYINTVNNNGVQSSFTN